MLLLIADSFARSWEGARDSLVRPAALLIAGAGVGYIEDATLRRIDEALAALFPITGMAHDPDATHRLSPGTVLAFYGSDRVRYSPSDETSGVLGVSEHGLRGDVLKFSAELTGRRLRGEVFDEHLLDTLVPEARRVLQAVGFDLDGLDRLVFGAGTELEAVEKLATSSFVDLGLATPAFGPECGPANVEVTDSHDQGAALAP